MARNKQQSSKGQNELEKQKVKSVRRRKFKLKQPKNRKRLIRDLPREAAFLLHPTLRGILTGKQKRWNCGSPAHRVAVNLVKRSKRQIKPRVMPFFCDKCRLSSRSLKTIREHDCELTDQRRADRTTYARKFTDYSYAHHAKLVQNPEKQWRYNSMAAMEQTLLPNKVFPLKDHQNGTHEMNPLDSTPDQKFLDAERAEYDDEIEFYQLKDVLVKNTQRRPKCTMKIDGKHPGVFCFCCKGSFQSFNQYQLHLDKSFADGKCSQSLPSYHYTQKEDETGLFNMKYRHSIVHAKPIKRDVSHVKCTLCQVSNFKSTKDLYAHMMECASKPNINGERALDRPTEFGGQMTAAFDHSKDLS